MSGPCQGHTPPKCLGNSSVPKRAAVSNLARNSFSCRNLDSDSSIERGGCHASTAAQAEKSKKGEVVMPGPEDDSADEPLPIGTVLARFRGGPLDGHLAPICTQLLRDILAKSRQLKYVRNGRHSVYSCRLVAGEPVFTLVP
jgi:hypothetical protein